MNRNVYRLLFDAQRCMCVPVAEHVRAGRRGQRRLRRAVLVLTLAAAPTLAADLPVPAAAFVTRGSAAPPVVSGTQMSIRQTSNVAVLNWQSFDIGRGHGVEFVQPGVAARAINLIGGHDPSRIQGNLRANGQVLLFNRNGILFGEGARIDVGGLLASALQLKEDLHEKALSTYGAGVPALELAADAPDTAAVRVETGAQIVTAPNGRVFLAAPVVSNAGHISTPEGQTILAAGRKVYLADPLDARLRGFLVEVDAGGLASNERLGRIVAERGNITLAGLAVKQDGLLRTTTSVNLNGSIHLQARDTAAPLLAQDADGNDAVLPVGTRTGSVTFGGDSLTEVAGDLADTARIRDDAVFNPSQIRVTGRSITLADAATGQAGARILAHGGEVSFSAQGGQSFVAAGTATEGARIHLGRGARIDVSGLRGVTRAAADDVVEVDLRGEVLADSPLQRDPAYGRALYGRRIWVDMRKGTPLGNVAGYRAGLTRAVAEKLATGGSVELKSEGDVLMHRGAAVDVTGGSVAYQDSVVPYSLLRYREGGAVEAAAAAPDRIYSGVLNGTRRESGYVEGRDAGSVRVTGYRLALDGELRGQVVSGPNQRSADKLPKAGELSIGNASGVHMTPEVRFTTAPPARELGAGDEAPSRLDLPTTFMTQGGFGRLTLYSDGAVTLPAGTTLPAGAGGAVSIRAREIDVEGTILAPGGSVRLETVPVTRDDSVDPAAHDLRVGTGARIDTAGLWINDARKVLPTDPAPIDGGSILLASQSDLAIAAGALLDVSAGVWWSGGSKPKLGKAGRTELKTGDFNAGGGARVSSLHLGGTLQGYGLAYDGKASAGGTLRLATSAVRIDGASASVSTAGGLLGLGTGFFDAGGFGAFSVSGHDGLRVAGGSVLQPRPLTRMLERADALAPTGSNIGARTETARLPATWRAPTSVELSADGPLQGDVKIEAGARIEVDAGGRIALRGEHRIDVAGTLRAPGGNIVLKQSGHSDTEAYDPTRTIFLADGARLEADGATRLQTPGRYREGEVLAGGTIEIDAARGYFVAQADSRLSADGASDVLDLPAAVAGNARQPVRVDSNGGRILLSARDGLLVDGVLSARGGGQALGGSLEAGLRMDEVWSAAAGDPVNAGRRLVLSQDEPAGTAALAAGAAMPASAIGIARLAVDRVRDGGFADLRLFVANRKVAEGNRIEIGEDLGLAMPRLLEFDTPNLVVSGGASGRFSAAAWQLGNSLASAQYGNSLMSVGGGSGSLSFSGRLGELAGNVAVSGVARLNLESTGDLRVSGVAHDVDLNPAQEDFRLRGSLISGGDIDLKAAQVYPTTQSEFSVEIHDRAEGRIRILPSGTPAGAPLSAGGSLTLSAPRIEQQGVLRAPFGRLTFVSERNQRSDAYTVTRTAAAGGLVTLAADSLTSVSGEGLSVPFGTTELSGRNWVFSLGGGRIDYSAPPQKAVTLKGDRVDVAAGARLDLSGGGELTAWEFVPGPGGSTDLLAAANLFAVLPGLTSNYAPRDVQNWAASGLKPGDALVLTAAAGRLPAGAHTLLPARYALLPGAYLVSLTGAETDMPAGGAVPQQDGTVRVAARSASRLADGSLAVASRTQGVLVMSGEQLRQRAEYLETRASDYYAGLTHSQRPGDAGRLQLQAGSHLGLEGELQARHGAGFQGAKVDLTAARLEVTAAGAAASPGFVGVAVGTLNSLGAQSLLLGAVREEGADGVTLHNGADDYGAQELRIAGGATQALSAPEVMAVANGMLEVTAGTRIEASGSSGAAPGTLRLEGDGALLRVAAGAQSEVVRSGVTRSSGSLEIAAGAQLAGRSVILDATRDNRSAGSILLPLTGGALAVAAGRISAGETSDAGEGLVFSNDRLAALGNPAQLRLKSYGSLDLHGEVRLGTAGMDSLQIEAGAIVGRDNDGKHATLQAKTVRIGNADSTTAVTATSGTGTLRIRAERVDLADGAVAYRGFAATEIAATREVIASGSSAGADSAGHAFDGRLDITAARITAAAAADQRIAAAGELNTAGLPAPPDQQPTAAGGALTLEAARIVHGGLIDLPAGRITLRANGAGATDNIELLAGSRIAAAGVTKDFDGKTVAAPAGSVALESLRGDVALRAGAEVDVSGVGGADAGSLALRAPAGSVYLDGRLRGTAAAGAMGETPRQGRLTADARNLPALDAMADAAGEFKGRLDLRQRVGDMALSAGRTLKAQEIRLAVDAGNLELGGRLDASGAKGGTVELHARSGSTGGGDVVLAAGSEVDASATSAGASRGGQVLLEAAPETDGTGGRVRLADGSRIRVGAADNGEAGGRVVLRAARAGTGVNIEAAPGVIEGAREVIAEGTRVYLAATPNFAAAHVDNNAFMANAAAIRSALAFPAGDGTTYRVRPHVEYRSSSDFTLSADTSLAGYRYFGEAATLTVRAAGDIVLNGSLSDGFSSAAPSGTLNDLPAQSWSYRLTAGADTTAAAPSSVRPLAELAAAGRGDFRLAANKLLRTGSADIAVTAGRDIRLANDGAVIYAAGADDPTVSGDDFFVATNIGSRRGEFPAGGGEVRLTAVRDVIGGGGGQLINDWLYRMGSAVNDDGSLKPVSTTVRRVAWWPRFDQFRQGVGAFGGGDVTVEAGRDVANLGVVAPTNGRLPGAAGSVPARSDLRLQGGGDVSVSAGRDILSGVYYSGAGEVRLDAGGALGSGRSNSQGLPVFAAIGLGEASARVSARRDATLEAVINPTLLEQAVANSSGSRRSLFVTYGAGSALDLLSVAGDAVLQNGAGKSSSGFTFATTTAEARFHPARVSLTALQGDVHVAEGMTLMPAAQGELALLAAGNLTVGGTIKMGDADPRMLPSPFAPITASSHDNWANNVLRVGATGSRAHDPALLATRSAEPVRLTALGGDIRHAGSITMPMLDVPKAVRLSAGKDIRDASVLNQHLSADDVTRLDAGGDIVFGTDTAAAAGGGQEPRRYEQGVITGGPGRVELIAGGSIGLGSSSGVVTRGNYDNPYLAEGGASILLQAGAHRADYEGLLGYLRDPARAALRQVGGLDTLLARYDAALTQFMRSKTGDPLLTPAGAAAAFGALDAGTRDAFHAGVRPLLLDLAFGAIRTAGSQGVRGGSFQPGYDVMAALFPAAGRRADIDLFYSQLRSEQNGGIRLLAPHGGVNVGLNSAGGNMNAARQGIFSIAGADSDIEAAVARDFAVNRSRVFTLGGADITIWSSYGNIDAGRGAKTAASTPPPQVRRVGDQFIADISAAVTGSGIGTLKGRADTPPGDVRLYAPSGYVDAGDAGIRAGGDLEIGGGFRGADNIQAGGSVSGVAVEAPPAAPPPAPPAPMAETTASERIGDAVAEQARAGMADSLFTVEVIGLGEEDNRHN